MCNPSHSLLFSPTTSLLALLIMPILAPDTRAQNPVFRKEHADKLDWRHLGPVNMIGRITDFEAAKGEPGKWFVASAGGGLFKTENAGITWTALFQNEGSSSLGDVAVAPSNSDIVWVGTGEENARNSVSFGDGVYKSTDGGKTFAKMGLEKSFQIGHIAIHPKDPNIVYVAALGRLWGPSEERGVYRTRDGGKTWTKILYADERTGCIDVRIEPSNADIVYAVMYERMRDEFDTNDPATRFGPKSGIYRSTDAGESWKRMSKGLPSCNWGRCSLEPFAGKKGTLFALIETERSGWARGDSINGRGPSPRAYMGVAMEDDPKGARLEEIVNGQPAEKAGFKKGDIVTAIGATSIKTIEDLGDSIDDHKNGDKVKVAVLRKDKKIELDLRFGPPPPSGRIPNAGRLGGQNGNIQSRQGELGYETGGIYHSDDFGVTWKRLNSLIPRPFYFCSFTIDPNDEQTIYVCGIQLWKSTDGGNRFRQCNSGIHVDFHDIWVNPMDSEHVVASSDGGVNVSYDGTRTWEVLDNFCCAQFYHVGLDNSLPYNVYGGLQDNGTWGGPSRTRYSNGLTKEDWIKIYSGDGFGAAVDPENPNIVFATSQNGNVGRVNLETGAQQRVSRPRVSSLKFNWDTPFFISPHNNKMFYFAGNFVFRSLDRGTNSETISEKISLTSRGSATAVAESPRVAGILYVGTDDGGLWVTRDAGKKWDRIDTNLPEMPGPRYVSSIAPSRHSTGRVFVTLDGHRSDDNTTYVFASSNYGKTWKLITTGLPKDSPAHVVVEDPKNNRLLFVGTEFGCHVSLDRGKSWLKLSGNFPTVAVRDLEIQDRDADLVAATHGRGFWVLDIEPLRQLTRSVARKGSHLFAPKPSYLWRTIGRYQSGHKMWSAPKAPAGSAIYLSLDKKPEKAPEIVIKDLAGEVLATLKGKAVAGVQHIQWNARSTAAPPIRSGASSRRRPPAGVPRGGARGGARSGRRRGRSRGTQVKPGTYQASITLDGKTLSQAIELRPDPDFGKDRNSHPLRRN